MFALPISIAYGALQNKISNKEARYIHISPENVTLLVPGLQPPHLKCSYGEDHVLQPNALLIKKKRSPMTIDKQCYICIIECVFTADNHLKYTVFKNIRYNSKERYPEVVRVYDVIWLHTSYILLTDVLGFTVGVCGQEKPNFSNI